MNLAEITPNPTDRALIIGQTGSGKTTLARTLLNQRRYVVILDTKGQIRWPEFELIRNANDLAATKTEKILFIPPYEWTRNTSEIDAFFRWIYERQHTTVYIDELAAVTEGDQYPFHLGACFMRGRELGIEVWASTQRPLRIPQVALSESEHVYCFRLRLPQDRQRVEAVGGIPQSQVERLRKFDFLYSRQSDEVLGPYRLKLEAPTSTPTIQRKAS